MDTGVPSMSEAKTEKAFERWVESIGGEAFKLQRIGKRGWPDRSVLLPGGVILFLEFKAPRGKIRPQQRTTIARLRELGFVAEIVYSVEEAKAYVERALSAVVGREPEAGNKPAEHSAV